MTFQRTRLNTTAALGLALALLATGCRHNLTSSASPDATPPPPAGPVPVATLTADPLAIDLGQSVVLNWRTSGATSVSIDGIGDLPANGTQTVSPSSSTNFHLVAKNDSGGTTDASVRVTVRVPVLPSNPGPGPDSLSADKGSDAAFHAAVQDLFFDYDSFDLRPDAATSISAAASYLSAHPAVKVLIGGYCDDRGSAEYNITLGENRANAAKSALVAAGVPASRVRVVSYGKEKQFCTDEDESCWQQNRRAQFSVDR